MMLSALSVMEPYTLSPFVQQMQDGSVKRRRIAEALVFAAAFACTSCDSGARKTEPAQIVSVNAIRVSSKSIPDSLEEVGAVRAYEQADLRSRVTGLVTARLFKGGQTVKKDQLLYTIDPTTYRNDVANAQASLAQAKAALAQAQGDEKRYETLIRANAIARQTYDQAVSTAKQNAAVVAARQTALQLANLNLAYTRITAPVDGQVDNPQVDVGSMVTAGQTALGTVSTLDPVYVDFNVPEALFVTYTLQNAGKPEDTRTPITINLLLPNGAPYPLPGRMESGSRTIASNGTYAIHAVFQNASGVLRPGMNVRVKLTNGQTNGILLIPQRAMGDILGRKYVFVIDAKDRIEQRMIDIGAPVGDLQVVQKGLRDGEAVVADGIQFVKPGTQVKAKFVPLESASGGG